MFRASLPLTRLLCLSTRSTSAYLPTQSTNQNVSRDQNQVVSSKQLLVSSKFTGPTWSCNHPVLLFSTSARLTLQIPKPAEIFCNFTNMAKCIDLKDLKDCPAPAFWVTFGSAAVQLGVPFLELYGGYSPFLTYLQLFIGAAHLGFSAGEKWALAVFNDPTPSWESMSKAMVPTTFFLLGLSLPYPLGFLTIATGILSNFYIDLKSCLFPPWQIASKALMALSSVAGLLLACIAYVLFNNKGDEKSAEKQNEKTDKAMAEIEQVILKFEEFVKEKKESSNKERAITEIEKEVAPFKDEILKMIRSTLESDSK